MATSFPSGLDSFTNPTAVDTLDSPPHDVQHADANDAIEALQAKVGVDGSAVTSSIDYKLNTLSYQYVQTVYFTSSGTFTKATYPWLRALRVRVVGGGGGGGRGQTGTSSGGGGGGGGYCEQWLDVSALGASETVTIGAGGAGTGGGGGGIDGTAGGASSFGSLISCAGGSGGIGSVDSSSRVVSGGFGGGVTASGSYVQVLGGRGAYGVTNYGGPGWPGRGGETPLGTGGESSGIAPAFGTNGGGYGAGGSGGLGSGASINRDGGVGASGIIIVELYA